MNGNNIYNYMNNLSIENNAYGYVSNKNRAKIGKEVINFIKQNGCSPEKIFSKIANKRTQKGGFTLRKIKTTKPIRFSEASLSNKNIVSGAGIASLAQGSMGVVYIGCIDKQCKKEVAIKQAPHADLKPEYAIASKVQSVSPHIARVYALNKCSDAKALMYSEYFPGNSMIEWVAKTKSHQRPIYMRNMIFQVLYTLRKLQNKYPGFRHNDLHGGNVFINDRFAAKGSVKYTVDGTAYYVKNAGVSACLADFGFAAMPGMKNPIVNTSRMKSDYGIGPKSHPLYDVHLFLNSVYGMIGGVAELSTAKKFIESIFSKEYLGMSSAKINEFRLKYGTAHPTLPSLKKILESPYFTGVMSKKVAGVVDSFPGRNSGGPFTTKSRNGRQGRRPVNKMNTIREENETASSPPKKIRKPRRVYKNKPKSSSPPKNKPKSASPPKSPPNQKLSTKNLIKFIITDGTKKAQVELTKVFIPGNKLPSRAQILAIVGSFAKGKKLLPSSPKKKKTKKKPTVPQVAPPFPPSKLTSRRYPATYANIRRMKIKRGKKPISVSPPGKRRKNSSSSPKLNINKALKTGVGPSWLFETKFGLISNLGKKAKSPVVAKKAAKPARGVRPVKFINFSKGTSKSTGRIRTSAVQAPAKRNTVQLNANDMRKVRALQEVLSNSMENALSNFGNREKRAREMAIAQITNQKRKLINAGLANSPVRKPVAQVAIAKSVSPLARKATAAKSPVPLKKVSTVKSGLVGLHTGKKAVKMVNGGPKKGVTGGGAGNFSMNMQNRLKIKGKLCDSHKKEEIQAYLRTAGITYTQKATKSELCGALKKKYF